MSDLQSAGVLRGLLNMHPQDKFAQLDKFGLRGMNIHTHSGRTARSIVVFVHGFTGHGYKTWNGLPAAIFDSSEGELCDVAVYHYKTFIHALPYRNMDLDSFGDQLASVLSDMAKVYSEIYVVAHSLGGLVSSIAIRRFLDEASQDLDNSALTNIAALVLFASPRAGAWLARPYLSFLIREFKWLKTFSKPVGQIQRFFDTNVEGMAVADAGPRRYIIPRYACIGLEDLVVNPFSATFGIPPKQTLPLNGTHTSIVKPVGSDSEQVSWLMQIISDVKDVRKQYRRVNSRSNSSAMAPRAGRHLNSPFIVSELWTGTDTFEWKEIYDQVRNEASTANMEVLDQRQGFHPDDVDILISLHHDESITAGPPGRIDNIVERIRERHKESELLHVGIATIGQQFSEAEEVLKKLVDPIDSSSSFYIRGVADGDSLREVLYRWIRALVESRASRQKIYMSTVDTLVRENPSTLEEER